MDTIPELDELLVKLQSVQGSDLHLKVGSPPAYRISGDLHLSNLPKLRPQHTEAFARERVDRARCSRVRGAQRGRLRLRQAEPGAFQGQLLSPAGLDRASCFGP